MTKEELKQKALDFHKMNGKPGKVSVIPTKPCNTGDELSLAYTPGVAQPCLEIKDKPETVWEYTSRGNMVAVVSDGTAVLGLGNIGPEAGLPVMEGKAVLFKHFADIDAVPICLGKVFNEKGRTDAAKVIAATECLEPTFGGINLAKAMKEINSDVKIIFVTVCTKDEVARELIEIKYDGFLSKLWAKEELVAALKTNA